MNSHSKTSNEFQYLEFGIVGIPWIIANRRMIYYRNLIVRSEDETIKKVLRAQQKYPCRGDWWSLLKEHFEAIGLEINEKEIIEMNAYSYKK